MKYVIVFMELYEYPKEATGIFDTEEQAVKYAFDNFGFYSDFRVIPLTLV
jgi:hypothetical protein